MTHPRRTGPRPEGPEFLFKLETAETSYQGEVAPGVYVFGAQRPMGRIRSYSAAGLTPFAGRGVPSEFLLTGHVHVDDAGKVSRVEGFNGGEGERWAKQAHERLRGMEMLSPVAQSLPLCPLRGCPHTGIR